MKTQKNVVVNFVGGAWLGILIVLTTPLYIADLGLEGFALVGIWQLLFYLSLIFDFGLGAACSRELARCLGSGAGRERFRSLFVLFERPIVVLAVMMGALTFLAAPLVAGAWLNVQAFTVEEVVTIVRLMAVCLCLQFITAFQLNALTGLQHMVVMNAVQVCNNSLRYLGGAAVLLLTDGIVTFFVFQTVAALLGLGLARWRVVVAIGSQPLARGEPSQVPSLRSFVSFSGGMFFTALCGALLANADRLIIGKMMSAEMLGRYTVALTAIGLLQTLVFAFHRAYFPRLSQLAAADDPSRLKAEYLKACALVGGVLVPVSLVFGVFTPELYTLWLGWTDPVTVLVSRLLVVGFVLSGVMWLPAAYQQAIGWTRLHAALMAISVLIGAPLLVICVDRFGLAGAAALMLTHGLIEITFGLWLMNRVCFPGENLSWYWRVLGVPMLVSAPVVALSKAAMPRELPQLAGAAWIAGTCAVLLAVALLLLHRRRRPER